jgi:hydroxymethylglutaryl-CoA lyase
MSGRLPTKVRIVEVGARDGLQNERKVLDAVWKVAFIEKLVSAGLTDVEAGSFVSASRVPQMADTDEVLRGLPKDDGVRYTALVPNARGLERARAAGAKAIAVFTAPSNEFTQRNIGRDVEESLLSFEGVIQEAVDAGMWVRGYLSVCFGCPYEGSVPPDAVATLAERLLAMGCDEISLGDSIGVASPADVTSVLNAVLSKVPVETIALHMHDTHGSALANVQRGLESGVAIFDAAAGGLGGCPFAPGASGNLATEDLVELLDSLGVHTGVDLNKLFEATAFAEQGVGRALPGRVYRAMRSEQHKSEEMT